MARLAQLGFELQSTTNSVEYSVISVGTSLSINTSTIHGGSASAELNIPTTASFSKNRLSVTNNASILYYRTYIYIKAYPSGFTNSLSGNNDESILSAIGNAGGFGFISLDTTGHLRLTDGLKNVKGSPSSALNLNQWYRVEFKVDLAQNPRNYEAKLDGTVFASGTQTFGANTINALDFGVSLSSEDNCKIDILFDDIAINDTTSSFQTSYPGAGQIVHVQPNATGDFNTFTVQVGGTFGSTQNWTRVNEVTPDDATSYNASLVLNQHDLFKVSSSGVGGSDMVNVVMVGGRFANITLDTTTAFKFEIEKTSGGTITQSSSIDPNSTTWKTNSTTSTVGYPIITYQDPDSSNWTSTTLGTMQIGYKLTTANVNSVAISTVWASIDYTLSTQPTVDVSDIVTTSESTTVTIISFVNVSDTTITSEFTDIIRAGFRDLSVSDSTTFSESVQPSIVDFINKSDTSVTSESLNQTLTNNISLSDSSTLSESLKLADTEIESVSDSVTASENISIFEANYIINTSDSIITSENISVQVSSLSNMVSVFDSITTSENIQLLDSEFINTSDSANIVESAEVIIPLVGTLIIITLDSVSLSENIKFLDTEIDSVSDAITASESIQLLETSFVNISDSTVTSESINVFESNLGINVSDNISLAESVTKLITGSIVTSDTSTISENKQLLNQEFITISDAAVIIESVILVIPLTDTLFVIVNDNSAISELITFGQNAVILVSDSVTTVESVIASIGRNIVRTSSFTISIPSTINFKITKTT